MKRIYLTWNPDDGVIDKHAPADKQLRAHKFMGIVSASSPKAAARMVAPKMGHDNDLVSVMLADQLGSYNAKTRTYYIAFKRTVSRVVEQK